MNTKKDCALAVLQMHLKQAADYCWLSNDLIATCIKQGIFTGQEPEVLETKALLERLALEGLDWSNPEYLQGKKHG